MFTPTLIFLVAFDVRYAVQIASEKPSTQWNTQ
jgi:hypothetical protein